MKKLIETVLSRTGHPHLEPTEDNLISVYIEFAERGIFGSYEEFKEDYANGDLTLKKICYNLINLR